MPVPAVTFHRIAPQTGTAVRLRAGSLLEIVDPSGQQVADLAFFVAADPRERFSPGRTLDYTEKIALSSGDTLYSNRSSSLVRIERDDVRTHDYLLAPCSRRMFEILRDAHDHPSCHGNLSAALAPFNVSEDDIDATFNAFMRVDRDAAGRISVEPPPSRAGDAVVFRAALDLIVGITACSSEHSNAGRCKPIDYRILD